MHSWANEPLLLEGAEAVPGTELSSGLAFEDAVDQEGALADEELGLPAGVGQADDLDGLGKGDELTAKGQDVLLLAHAAASGREGIASILWGQGRRAGKIGDDLQRA